MNNTVDLNALERDVNLLSLYSYKANIVSKTELVPNTFELVFDVGKPYQFVAGQYTWITLDNLKYEDPRGNIRAFSIMKHDNNPNLVSIAFRKSDSGYKKTLLELEINDTVTLSGPRGAFTLNDLNTPVILIAGGVGITPFISILESIVQEKSPRQAMLFISNSGNDRRIYSDRIEKLVKENKNIYINEIIGEHINWDALNRNLEDKKISAKEALWYVSGPREMVTNVYQLLKQEKVSNDRLIFDEFRPNLEPKRMTIDMLADPNQNNSIFELAVNEFTIHLIITDIEGVILFANRAAEITTGFRKDEMIGQTPRLWGGLMSVEFYRNMWNTIKYEKRPFVGEVVNMRKNGEVYTTKTHISPVIDKDSNLLGFIATEFDITDLINRQKQLQEKISEYKRLNKLMIEREVRMVELKKQIEELEKTNHIPNS